MTDHTRQYRLESGLYLLAFGLALALRLLRLGEIPLGDDEASWALHALDLVRGQHTGMGFQPAYVVLTGLAYFLLQASNFAARLVPAIFGALLCLVPLKFRDILGHKPALIMAFLLVFDPGFLALSRLAGSPILVIAALLFAWGAWRSGSLSVAGVWIGLALLSGPLLWPGLLGLVLANGLQRVVPVSGDDPLQGNTSASSDDLPALNAPGVFLSDRKNWLTLFAYAVGTYILLGSFFLLASGGLGAGLASVPAYFSGWIKPFDSGLVQMQAEAPTSRLVLALVLDELMAVIFALVGLVRGILRRDKLTIWLGFWLLTSLILALAYPSRQVADLGWVLIPLLSLAAREISIHLVPVQEGTWETLGMAIFTSAILVFAFLNYSDITLMARDASAVQLRWWILLGSLGLLAVSTAMVGFGWSVPTAVQGGVWGLLFVLLVYTVSASVASAGLKTYRTTALWSSGSSTGQAKTLLSQMNDLSRWKNGTNSALDVTIAGVESPALLWLLRDWQPTSIPDLNLSGSSPSVVIASDKFSSTEIESVYRGQDLSWRILPLWDQGLPTDWMRWSILHEFPYRDEKLILWVRSDVFIDLQNGQ